MSTQILTTKLYTPALRSGSVPRPHLMDRLNAGKHGKLTLISAPAGFGKTTLITEWISTDDLQVAWLSLDDGDSDPVRFLTYIVTALQTVKPEVGVDILNLLESPQPPPIDSLVTPLLNQLTMMPEDFVLVLDDYHVLDSQEIDKALAFLIDNQPPQIHIVITTREDPRLPLARLRVRGQLSEIRAADLRFTIDEASEFLNSAMGLSLSSDDVAALEQRTEGWIAGLQLAAISMQGRENQAQFLEAFTGSNRYIMDYLLEEVLNQQSLPLRTFLLQTSTLTRFNASLCNAVTQQDDSQFMLEQIEKYNLFLIPLDHERQWYRYHHLFAHVLQARLKREIPDGYTAVHRRASHWYKDKGAMPDSIRHAFLAEDHELVARLLELVWAELDLSYQAGQWSKWAKRLPQEMILAHPLLCLGFAWSLVSEGDFTSGEPYLDVAEKHVHGYLDKNDEENDLIHWRMMSAGILSARAYIALAHHEIDQAIHFATKSLTHSADPMNTSHRQASAVLGFALWAKGDLQAADETFEDFLIKTNYLEIGVIPYIADLRVELGKMQDAQRIFEEGLARIDKFSPYIEIELYRRLAKLHLDLGNWDKFKNYLDLTRDMGETFAPLRWEQRYYATHSQYLALIGDYDTALSQLDLAERDFLPTAMPTIRPIAAQKTRIWILQGPLDKAEHWAYQHHIAAEDWHYLKEYEHITLAQLRVAQYRKNKQADLHEQASTLLARLLTLAETGSRVRSAIEIQILQAQLAAVSGDLETALSILDKALDLAAPQGYVALFGMAGDDIKSMLQVSKHPYARQLLATSSDISKDTSPSQAGLIELLSERELEILRLIAEGLSNREISKRLFVALDTVKGHNRNIYQKLQVKRRTEAVARARELGLI